MVLYHVSSQGELAVRQHTNHAGKSQECSAALVFVKLLLALRLTDLAIGPTLGSLVMAFPVLTAGLTAYSLVVGTGAFVGKVAPPFRSAKNG